MRKAIFISTDLVFKDVNALGLDQLYRGTIPVLGRITRQLEFELVLVSNENAEQAEAVRNFLGAQEIDVKYHFTISEIPNQLQILNDGVYELAQSWVILKEGLDTETFAGSGISELRIDPAAPDFWYTAFDHIKKNSRNVRYNRKTAETSIQIDLNLDGSGQSAITSGLGFFDHMLDQIARHSGIDLSISVTGDLRVDEHHTVEDTGLALGEAVAKALGKKTGIERYGFFLPMDESICRIALDFSGRSFLVWKASFSREKVGDVPTELFEHFFKSFCDSAGCNLYVEAQGENDHHLAESIFKAFARALRTAIKKDFESDDIPSTKGIL